MTDTPLLSVDDLVTTFVVPRGLFATLRKVPATEIRAVDGVSFTVRSGELLALVGESGSGKTTTAQSLLHLIPSTGGTVLFKGGDISHLKTGQLATLRRQMQVIYQDPYESLDPRFRVRDIVAEPLVIHGIGAKGNEREEIVRGALEQVGLTPPDLFLDRFPHELSGGQRQRVAIATALTLQPELLIADEPVSMLDVSVRAGVLELLDDLRDAGLGILMITHDLSTAARYADRIAVMYLGRIVEIGTAEQIVKDPRHPYTRALLSVVPRPSRAGMKREILQGETPNAAHIPSGCRFHPRCPVAVETCSGSDPALEAVPQGPKGHDAACLRLGDLIVNPARHAPAVVPETPGADGVSG